MTVEKGLQKGQYIVEPGIAISEFVEKINKLSYQDFPVDEIIKLLQKNPLSLEYLEPYMFFSDARYTRNLIHKSSDFELLLLCWNSGQYSAIHGNEGQKCWMRVEKGSLEFTDYQEEADGSLSLLKKKSTQIGKKGYIDGPSIIHSVKNIADGQAISLYLYAKPFDECNIYDLNQNIVKKISLGYHSIHGKLVAIQQPS